MTEVPAGKLVRDRVPAIMAADGEPVATVVLSEDRPYRQALLRKLVEEAQEASEASDDKLPEEMADVLEVLEAVLAVMPSLATIISAKASKRAARGGFTERLLALGMATRPVPPEPARPEPAEDARLYAIRVDARHYAVDGVLYERDDLEQPQPLDQMGLRLVGRIKQLDNALAAYAHPDDWYLDEVDGHWRFFGHDAGPYLAQRVLGTSK